MAFELVTGKTGTPHVDSSDIGAYQAFTVGAGEYILNGCAATMASANTVAIQPGALLVQGRLALVSGTGVELSIDNGQSGYRRNDIVAMHYTRDTSGVESAALVVVKGTPTTGTPADPAMPTSGTIMDNAADTHIPLWRVALDGLTPSVATIAEANPTANNTQGVLSPEHGGTGYNGNNLAPYAVLRANGTAGNGMRGVPTADGAMFATGANKEPSFGTLPVAQGGTGGTTAKAAQYNLLNNMSNKTNALTDDWKIIVGHGTPSTTNGMIATMSTSLLWTYISGKMGDYVESQGTTSNWNYVKFANGIFICEQQRDITAKTFSAFGNQFRSAAVSLSLPFKVQHAVVLSTGGDEIWGVGTAAGGDTNTISVRYYAASSGSKAFTSYTLAMGRWK